ncbi:tRNA (adenosine(37)-N6)-threonylcarbamoyltransferase complex dimerization subunit type 1 TsaB [bacterium]|nr:tRNA (adenosine(37)-N6)-threonylcarbamoyltransferase complex dimerization subunit type 1 TsaB [bacterium]
MLAVDTSLAHGSVAAVSDGQIVEISLPEAAEHARRIGPAVEEAARSLGWRVADVELVGVVRGPGSFTGLRVGLALAKAIAWAAEAALVGVSGFEVVARRTARSLGAGDSPLHLAYDAGRGDLFVAEALPAADAPSGFRLSTPQLVAAAEWSAALPRGARVSGPGLAAAAAALAARADLFIAPAEARLPTAADAAALAERLHAAGVRHAPAALLPDYLRPTYADEPPSRREVDPNLWTVRGSE